MSTHLPFPQGRLHPFWEAVTTPHAWDWVRGSSLERSIIPDCGHTPTPQVPAQLPPL